MRKCPAKGVVASGFVVYRRSVCEVERVPLMVSLAVLLMFAAAPASGIDDFAYPYASNDGMGRRWEEPHEQGSMGRWTRNWQPWAPGQQGEPVGRSVEPWRDYDDAPYTMPGGNDGLSYGPRSDGWSSSAESARSATDWPRGRPPYAEPYADGMRDHRRVGQPAFRGQYGDYGYERSTPPADPWVEDGRDGVRPEGPQWYDEKSRQHHRYPEQPVTRDRRSARNDEVPRAVDGERSRDPWDASYTPDWGVDDSSSYYDPEAFEPWGSAEVDRNGWDGMKEERPWARRRPSVSEDSRSTRRENRRWADDGSPEAASRNARGVGPYGGSWYYPGPQSFYPPPFGMPGPGAMSGLAAWERLLWAGGWPGMIWW